MILGTPDTVPGEWSSESHGGKGDYFVRTLLDKVPGSAFKYVRDLILYPGSTIGEHLHSGDEEVYFIVSGTGVMVVDGEKQVVSPGSAILTSSGSSHGLRNEGADDLRVFVVCAESLPPPPDR
jgi:mannose-6-phosphate isomerase-like protein (cupin superfamily)